MISGIVTEDGVPLVTLRLDDEDWVAIIDTGFNGSLELPAPLSTRLKTETLGFIDAELAAGVTIREELFEIQIDFDGEPVAAQATFADVRFVLIGTRLLARHRLEIDFVSGTVRLTKAQEF